MKYRFPVVFLVMLWIGFLNAQNSGETSGFCVGPLNNGEVFALMLVDESAEDFEMDGISFTIQYNEPNVTIDGPSGINFHTDGFGYAANIGPDIEVSTLSPFEAGPVSLYNSTLVMGPFAGGNGGYVGFEYNGFYGWLQLDLCGETDCADYRFAILNGRVNNTTDINAVTGICPLIPIPTITQWGMIILLMVIIIISSVALLEIQKNYGEEGA